MVSMIFLFLPVQHRFFAASNFDGPFRRWDHVLWTATRRSERSDGIASLLGIGCQPLICLTDFNWICDMDNWINIVFHCLILVRLVFWFPLIHHISSRKFNVYPLGKGSADHKIVWRPIRSGDTHRPSSSMRSWSSIIQSQGSQAEETPMFHTS